MKPWYRMSYREQEKYLHEQKRKEIPVPDIDAIRKGFEVCLGGGLPDRCVKCPYHNNGCSSELHRDALDLINIQAARIAELEEALKRGKG